MQHLQEYLHKLYRYAMLNVRAKSAYYIISIIILAYCKKVLNDSVVVSISNVTKQRHYLIKHLTLM